ncbi:MAG: hypothetical protein QXP98_01900 [Thermoproteus sp.]
MAARPLFAVLLAIAFLALAYWRSGGTRIYVANTTTDMGCVELKWPDQSPAQAGKFIAQINMWNLRNASGSAVLRYCNGTFSYVQDLTDIVEINAKSWVAGYPEVWFGYKPWAKLSSPGSPLPMKVADLLSSNLTIYVNYDVEVRDPSLPLDFAFDIWVTKSLGETSVGPGEQEIMIWLYHQQLRPAGQQIGEVVLPVVLNGKPIEATFQVYRQPSMPWEYLAFVLTPSQRSGAISFKLADFIKAAAKFTTLNNYSDMWVDDVELGSEFGSPNTKNAAFSWTLYIDYSG